MAIQNAFPGPTGVTDQTEARKGLAGLVIRDTSGNARAGIFPRHGNALVTARSDMKVDVAGFECISVRGGGPLFQANDGTAQVTIATAPGANSRYDVVYAKQNESASPYSDGNDLAILDSVQGPVAASPSLAAALALLPAGAVPISSVLMPAGKTATNQSGVVIAPIHAFTTTTGGTIWVRTDSELAVTSGYNAMNGYAPGQLARAIDTGTTYSWNGTTWVAGTGAPTGQFTRSSDFTLTAGFFVTVPFTTAPMLQGLTWSSGTNPSRITATVAGNYLISGNNLIINSTGNGDMQIRVNGTTTYPIVSVANVSGAATLSFVQNVPLAAGDYVEVLARTSGGAFPWIAANKVNVDLVAYR